MNVGKAWQGKSKNENGKRAMKGETKNEICFQGGGRENEKVGSSTHIHTHTYTHGR